MFLCRDSPTCRRQWSPPLGCGSPHMLRAYADDLQILTGAAALADASPLGTAAGYGTSLPIDRELTASLLAFDRLIITSPYAQMSRGRTERQVTGSIASLPHDFEICLRRDPVHVTRLRVCFTLRRAYHRVVHYAAEEESRPVRADQGERQQAAGRAGEVALMTGGLPPGYNRDYQELKAVLVDAFDGITELVQILPGALEGLIVNTDILSGGRYNDIFSVEEANRMVRDGVPFRDAYRIVAGKTGSGSFKAPVLSDYSIRAASATPGRPLSSKRLDEIMTRFVRGTHRRSCSTG